MTGIVRALATVVMVAGLISIATAATDMQHQSGQHSESKHATMHHAMKADSAMQGEVVVDGVVKRVLTDSKQIIVQHQPIPQWNMSAMQMKFDLADGLLVSDFKVDQEIHFRLGHKNMMKFTILELVME
ncbi:hypothetical protein AMJAP_1046 [Amphritea japonica ATCC BAA-1530]|uniref:Copper-binding protein n=2 Tax=Amphritea TaxID=515417 RepID=A0A7R6PA29_9GAMM|nr:hypothetical protein AMJAP_1046 [Amphritea japonica ATCC BAA-1530]